MTAQTAAADIHEISSEGPGGWENGEQDTITSKVTGALRDRVRRRFGYASGTVTITENTYYGGYSEYTQENSKDFTVSCRQKSVTFNCRNDSEDFGSIFHRFDLWLRAAEHPEEIIREWFEETPFEQSEDGALKRYRAKEYTTLYGAMRRHCWRGLTEAYLETYEDTAKLVMISEHPNGFREIANRRHVPYSGGTPLESASKIALHLADGYLT